MLDIPAVPIGNATANLPHTLFGNSNSESPNGTVSTPDASPVMDTSTLRMPHLTFSEVQQMQLLTTNSASQPGSPTRSPTTICPTSTTAKLLQSSPGHAQHVKAPGFTDASVPLSIGSLVCDAGSVYRNSSISLTPQPLKYDVPKTAQCKSHWNPTAAQDVCGHHANVTETVQALQACQQSLSQVQASMPAKQCGTLRNQVRAM